MTDYSSLRFNCIQIWRITLHIFIELFLRNDLIKFLQTLQTFQQTWYRSSTILHHIFNNRSSKLFKHFIECRSSSQHLFQHSFHISFQQFMKQYFITTIEWQIFHNILSKYFITTIEWQIFHNILSKYFITTIEWQII